MIAIVLSSVVSAVVCVGIYVLVTRFITKNTIRAQREAALKEAEAEGEMIKKERILQAKEKFIQLKSDYDRQVNERNQKLAQSEQRAKQIEANLLNQQRELENRLRENERLKEQMEAQRQLLEHKTEEIDRLMKEQNARLEQISGMSSEDAKNILIENMKAEAKSDAAAYINETIEEAKLTATKEAKRIIVTSIQRVATETAIENAVTVFNIESDEVKGRIIGREGRNIRALETATGVDLIIDDTPEAITLSSFDQARREVARMTLERLIADGRIHPARIEETVEKCRRELEVSMKREGERAVMEVGVHGIHPDIVKLLGRLKFRTSFGQNVLNHSLEVAYISGLLASEMGVNVTQAKRAGLLHDIGKALDHEIEGSHIQIGVEIARKYKENPAIIHAIEAHHGDVEPKTPLAFIIQAADAISAARPGARRENVESYVKRLENLEEISSSFEGVEQAFAVQAGREVRIMVKPDVISDDQVILLARQIAKKIEDTLDYPGQIKVNVIRESRAIEYAK